MHIVFLFNLAAIIPIKPSLIFELLDKLYNFFKNNFNSKYSLIKL